jgi:sugar phosphate isomerase/epimerase
MTLRDRIGIDVGRKLSVEDAVAWAADNDVSYIDCQIDVTPNALESFDETRCGPIREAAAAQGLHLGLHTLSAVNIAEFSPYLDEAVDAYLRAYIDASVRLAAEWIVVHAGFHFTDDIEFRKQVSLERLKRMAGYAEEKGAKLLLENLNWEPDRAEVHFTINHATLVPEGIAGFLEALPTDRMEEVRVADNNGEYEVHLYPGEGIIDFADMFRRVEATGFQGHYMNAFGSLDDMLRGREDLVALADR